MLNTFEVNPYVHYSDFLQEHKLPDWTKILATNEALWQQSKAAAKHGSKVLIATNTAGVTHATILESLLAVALTLRGVSVHILLCDKVLPGCMRAEFIDIPDSETIANYKLPDIICKFCLTMGQSAYYPLELRVHHFSDLLTLAEQESSLNIARECDFCEIPDYQLEGIAVGEHAYAGALRYFAKGNLEDEPLGEVVLRRYLEASILTTYVTRRLLDQHDFDAACFHHGIYVPQGIIGEVCRSQDVRVINWNPAYRKNTFIFSHNDTYHHTLLEEPVDTWLGMQWNQERENEILSYLESRRRGTRDWIWFNEEPDEEIEKFAAAIGLDLNKTCVGLLTNVMWDAQLHYRANAFPDMLTWALSTIEYFATRPDLQLLMRIHPAEICKTAPSRQPILKEIKKHFSAIPKNVFIIPPESPVSTYAAMAQCNAVIIYGTKTGVELTSVGIPVIVGGEAWIRNKGLTLDVTSQDEYFKVLDQLPITSEQDPVLLSNARKYAFHFFFRRMIPLPFIIPSQHSPYEVKVDKLEELLPGNYPGLDLICDGILNGTPFIYPADKLGIHDI